MRDHNGQTYGQAVLPRFETIQEGSQGLQLQGIREYSYESHGLTEREREVVSLVVEGLSNADIASRLFVTEATVKKHLRTVYKKINVKNRFQLVKEVLG
ncbi:LuxR family transcriptional regulator [Paenibacillus nanensis]|uniref:LuxR family transcriptional regulator n=2 Tax=Paenibacillus nanensis TaxID=393251 RepID=A0A3A1V1W6_9BACL|nr:LuxR family transcriptional regulator [Paenibacillus nanensis]